MIRQIDPEDIVIYEGKLYFIGDSDIPAYHCVVLYYDVDTHKSGYDLEQDTSKVLDYYKDFCEEIVFKRNPWYGEVDVAKIRQAFDLPHDAEGLEQALAIAHCEDVAILDPDDFLDDEID